MFNTTSGRTSSKAANSIGLLLLAMSIASPVMTQAQSRDKGNQDQKRETRTPPDRNPPPQQREVHARREVVRTKQEPARPSTPPPVNRDPQPKQDPVRNPRDVPDRKPQDPRPGNQPDRKPQDPRPGSQPDRKPQDPRPGNQPDRRPQDPRPGNQPDRNPRDTRPGNQPDRVVRAPVNPRNPRVQTDRKFTRTPEGRRYDNGAFLRHGVPVRETWQKRYFPRGTVHYPYYRPTYISASVYISPFGFYFGVGAPYIDRSHGYYRRPSLIYIEVPIYSGDSWRSYENFRDTNYLNDSGYLNREAGLGNAVDEIREAFRSENIDSLVALTDPKIQIAVFLKGQYEYSLDADDYLDLTRDALRNIDTIQFDLTQLHRRAVGVYVVSGKHVYKDGDGRNRTVYVSFVLEGLGGRWTITQVGTAPDRIQEWK